LENNKLRFSFSFLGFVVGISYEILGEKLFANLKLIKTIHRKLL